MTTLNYAIQCKDITSGKTGCFAYKSPDKKALSPIFPNLPEFYTWANSNGWKTSQSGSEFLMTKD